MASSAEKGQACAGSCAPSDAETHATRTIEATTSYDGDAGDADGDAAEVESASSSAGPDCSTPRPPPPPFFVPFTCSADGAIADGAIDGSDLDAATDASGCMAGSTMFGFACQKLCEPPPTSTICAAFGVKCVIASCTIGAKPDGSNLQMLECAPQNPPCGRRPSGFRAKQRFAASDPVGAYLASSVVLEAASVDAFDILAFELQTHRAPPRHAALAWRVAEWARFRLTLKQQRRARSPCHGRRARARVVGFGQDGRRRSAFVSLAREHVALP
jgi:hypothetical protein